MNPHRLKARNYRTFADLDLRLPGGCVAIVGANGAGKSSLANIPDLCLFGPEGRSWAPYLTQGGESTELELELVFEHAGELYRIRRGYSARGSGKTTLDLERNALRDAVDEQSGRPDSWIPETRESQAATQTRIEELLGMTRETFRASSMLVQGDGAAFTEAAPRDRKRLLASILGLGRFETLRDLVAKDRRGREDEFQKIAGALEAADRELVSEDGGDRIAGGEAALARTGAALSELGLHEDDAGGELETLANAIAAGEALARAKAEATAEAATAAGRLLPLERRLAEADEAQTAIAVAEDEAASLTTTTQMQALLIREAELAGELETYRREVIARDDAIRTRDLREVERDAILAQSNVKIVEVETLDRKIGEIAAGHLAACPTCEQTLGEAARDATLGNLRARAQALEEEARAIRERAAAITLPEIPAEPPTARREAAEQAIATCRDHITVARQAELQRERLAGRLQVLREKVSARPTDAEVDAARAAHLAAQEAALEIEAPKVEELDVVRANALQARRRVDELAAQRRDLETSRAKIETALERLRALRDRSADARARRVAIQAEIDDLVVLERAYSRDGIPALIVRNVAIPSIETQANRILAELGTSYRVELRTEKATAAGTSEALDVIVTTDVGERPYETFSGGERTRINLALRIALARLLAHRRGAESRLLVIDEPEYLDQAGTAALAAVLEGLTGDFARILLISHVPDLRDAFDQTIDVVRSPEGYSQIGGLA